MTKIEPKYYGWMACNTYAMLLIATIFSLWGVASAQEATSAAVAPIAGNHSDETKHGTLMIEVRLLDPTKPETFQLAAGAIVRIEGEEDHYETDVNGHAKLLGISSKKVALQIKVVGVNICRVSDVPVTFSDRPLILLVEKSQNGKCSLQQ
ncbi:hypothetical protein BCAR13_1840008 [Paraburkholderia caribensis]|uniref:hypothetical protein n=1 Tax=Paraburkholderia caribensis TaxID=75105 RepID=UPI001CABB009|nr:hypothetical protein [Paraburkholderia caribensis]CAG9209319.1 hypothetical protein BCAR13_1840008 [Paraburkholderia caribensis]